MASLLASARTPPAVPSECSPLSIFIFQYLLRNQSDFGLHLRETPTEHQSVKRL